MLAVCSRASLPLGPCGRGRRASGPIFSADHGRLAPRRCAENWWQCGHDPVGGFPRSAIVEACVSAYCADGRHVPRDHWRLNDKGGRDRVKTSALSRILRRPNAYQSSSDFLLNATRSALSGRQRLRAGAAQRPLRDRRAAFDGLAPEHVRSVAETGEVFYQLGGNDSHRAGARRSAAAHRAAARRAACPAALVERRYPRPLIGESPLAAAARRHRRRRRDRAAANAVLPEPSAPVGGAVDRPRARQGSVAIVRDRWDEQSRGLTQGRHADPHRRPESQPWSTPGKDAALAELMKSAKSASRWSFAFRCRSSASAARRSDRPNCSCSLGSRPDLALL